MCGMCHGNPYVQLIFHSNRKPRKIALGTCKGWREIEVRGEIPATQSMPPGLSIPMGKENQIYTTQIKLAAVYN
jgi:hypothetical protein